MRDLEVWVEGVAEQVILQVRQEPIRFKEEPAAVVVVAAVSPAALELLALGVSVVQEAVALPAVAVVAPYQITNVITIVLAAVVVVAISVAAVAEWDTMEMAMVGMVMRHLVAAAVGVDMAQQGPPSRQVCEVMMA